MSQQKARVSILALGTVGLPLYWWFTGNKEKGYEGKGYIRGKDLFCYDTDPKKDYFDDINKADIIFVCVPTPPNPDGSCNTSIVAGAVDAVKDGKIIVIKSTVIPGTTQFLQNKNPKKALMFNGEYLTESQRDADFIHPARQIVGFTEQSKKYTTLVLSLLPESNFQSPLRLDYWRFEMTATEAEVVKYASNVFGFCKVIFGNMLYDYCEAIAKNCCVDVSYDKVREAVSADQRINRAWLGEIEHGGYRGAGGFCFPKDMDAHIQALKFHIKSLEPSLLKIRLEKELNVFEAFW
ncbi:MAG: UDP-glucose/GDP-mannose dehydrogenase family protein, partial [Candidatus Yanofskybacteria bacterium]|nr:UDP-glucose/GDP-mannose dehydrogenase family protein [Candidatus Yanofskybacteria bacterium]